jgi:diphthine-ammonia ligase
VREEGQEEEEEGKEEEDLGGSFGKALLPPLEEEGNTQAEEEGGEGVGEVDREQEAGQGEGRPQAEEGEILQGGGGGGGGLHHQEGAREDQEGGQKAPGIHRRFTPSGLKREMRLAALCSGGKDSALAMWRVVKEGHRVERVVTLFPRREDSWLFHYPNARLAELFARCAGIPFLGMESSGEREREEEELEGALRGLGVEGVVTGAVASRYQRRRVEEVCRRLGLKALHPLWGEERSSLLRELLREGFEVIVTSVSAEGLGEEWLGRRLDEGAVEELLERGRRYGFDPVGEGGEYETFVLSSPFSPRRVEVVRARKIWRKNSGYLLIEEARVV